MAGLTGTATVTLAGCLGDDDDDDPTPDPDADWADETFRLATDQDPSFVDPHYVIDNPTMTAICQTHDPLITYDEEGDVIAHLAEDWDVVDDGLRYEFTIRDGVEFHSGGEVDAEDVAYSFERAVALDQTAVQPFVAVWDGVEVVDDMTVAMDLNETFPPFLSSLGRIFVVSKDEVEAEATDEDEWAEDYLSDNDAGTGPYELVEFSPGEEIRYEAFEDYWGGWTDGLHFEEAVYDVTPEASTIQTLLEEGDAHKSDEWLPVHMYESLEDHDDVEVYTDPDLSPLHIVLNTDNEFLEDVHVRRALSYAMDYDTLTSEIAAGDPDQLTGPLPDVMPFHNPDATQYNYDLDAAADEIDASAFEADEIELEFSWTSGIDELRQIGLLLQDGLEDIGVEGFSLNEATWPDIVEAYTSRETAMDMIIVFFTAAYPDPHDIMWEMYHSDLWQESEPTYNQGHFYHNEEVNSLLETGRSAVDEDERRTAYQEAQEIITEEALGIWLYNEDHRNAVRADIDGYGFAPPSLSSLRSKRFADLHL